MPQIGDKIWVYNENHRDYSKGSDYRTTYADKWRPHVIVAETKVSWIIAPEAQAEWERKQGNPDNPKDWSVWGTKHKKKTFPPRGIALNHEDIVRAGWVKDNRWKLGEQVQRCDDYEKLKKIQDIMNEGQ